MINASIAHKVVGYFSYSDEGSVFCDDDACIIAGTDGLMHSYIKRMLSKHEKPGVVKKIRFGEIVNGLQLGGAYAFDKEAYVVFFSLAIQYGITDLPELNSVCTEPSPDGLDFIRIQFAIVE
jgi:hypothetical protein